MRDNPNGSIHHHVKKKNDYTLLEKKISRC
jgi:hypothetical protein